MPLPPGGYLSNSSSDLDIAKEFLRQHPNAGRTLLERHTGWSQYKTNKMLKAARATLGAVTKPPQLSISVGDLSQRLVAILQESPRTQIELCEALDCRPSEVRELLVSVEGVKREGDRFWIEKASPVAQEIASDREARKARDEARSLKAKYDVLLKEYEQKDEALNAALGIADQVSPVSITRRPSSGVRGQATAIAVISDWHAGAIVKPNTVNFSNEYNPEIFEERAHNFFRSLLSLITKERAAIDIHNLVLAIIGDLIENSLHPELVEEQTLSPIEQMLLAQNTIAGGLDYLLKESDLESIVIPTCPGNHGRTTDKMRAATNYKNSYEQLLYWSLARHYKQEPRITFQVSDSYLNFTSVYDKVIGWHHGDGTRWIGGVGGLIIPLRKFAYRVNQQRKIDVLVNGHWHTQFVDSDIWSNGSLVGATAYGMRLGFPPERPQQIFRLCDAEEGFTIYAPILVTKK